MSLDFSNWMRDDAHVHARRRLRADHGACVRRTSADAGRTRACEPVASARFTGPGAVALVADVVMVSVAAAVALVAAQSAAQSATQSTTQSAAQWTAHDTPKTPSQLHRTGETP